MEKEKQQGSLKKAVNNAINNAKKYAKKYLTELKSAYYIAYAEGWESAYKIPKRLGSKIAAACGYRKGIIGRRKSDKYIKRSQYHKEGK